MGHDCRSSFVALAMGDMPMRAFRSQVGELVPTNLVIPLCIAWVSVASNQASTYCGKQHTVGEQPTVESTYYGDQLIVVRTYCGRAMVMVPSKGKGRDLLSGELCAVVSC